MDGLCGQSAFVQRRKQIAPGGIIVVDDSWRYPELPAGESRARCQQVFESVGPGRFGVTSTEVVFY